MKHAPQPHAEQPHAHQPSPTIAVQGAAPPARYADGSPLIDHPPQTLITLQPAVHPAPTTEPRYGGLRCHWSIPYRPGTALQVRIVSGAGQTGVTAVVTGCWLDDDGYRIELGFCDPQQAFEVRMIEQLCHIQAYQQQIQRCEGRRLSVDQAAQEWIARYAGDFPAA